MNLIDIIILPEVFDVKTQFVTVHRSEKRAVFQKSDCIRCLSYAII